MAQGSAQPHPAVQESLLPAIRVMMMPADTNALGTIFGGQLLSLIDQAGAIGAQRLGIPRVVTVAMREVEFHQPVRVGDLVSCYATITAIGRTSVTTSVKVTARRPDALGESVEVTEADVVYVQVDQEGSAQPLSDAAREVYELICAHRAAQTAGA